MKTKWSAFLLLMSLLALASCGVEQFGTAPTNTSNSANALQVFHQSTCAGSTLVKPEVDILYVVDNSLSTYWIPNLRPKIQSTINSISSQFDYRIVMTPLLPTTSEASGGGGFLSGPGGTVTPIYNYDYQVLSNSTLPTSIPSSKKITSASEFLYGPTQKPAQTGAIEKGLIRTINFINDNDALFRDNAHLLIVLVSNGKDWDVYDPNGGGGHDPTVFTTRKNSFTTIKIHKDLQSLRFFSLTANQSKAENPACPDGTQSSVKSYGDMSSALGSSADHHDICGDMNSVFTAVNNSIHQVTLPHSYKYWPIDVAEGQTTIDQNHIKVIKTNPTSGQTVLTSGWSYLPNPSKSTYQTRIQPTVGEPTNARHLIQFSNYPTYPDCISVQVQGLTDYFGYFVIPKIPLMESVVIKVNGSIVPSAAYEYIAYQGDKNIKVAHAGYSDTPEVKKSGYMFRVKPTHTQYYYKSGDNVEIHYIPASI